MGCFLACFGRAKDRKQRRRTKKSLPSNDRVNQTYQALLASPSPQKPVNKAEADIAVPELRANKENQEQGSFNSCRKKVTFDLNVQTYESIKDPSEEEEAREVKEEVKEENSAKVSPISNYRYQNCDSSEDECIDDELEEVFDNSDFDNEDDETDVVATEEESYDSYFSLPMDKEEQQSCQEVDGPMPVSALDKGSARDRSQYVHSVLNPVENLSQWKEVKARAVPSKNPNKENITSFTPKTSKEKTTSSTPNTWKSPNKENNSLESENTAISVDASLSTWLVPSENSLKEEEPQRSRSKWPNSSTSREDEPILGALTVEDLKHSSVTSSPRRSPSRNPDDIIIMGTVGSYWNCRDQSSDVKGIRSTTGKHREDVRVDRHSRLLSR